MIKEKWIGIIVGTVLLLSCLGATNKRSTLVGKWKEYKTTRGTGDTLPDGSKLIPFMEWEFTENKMQSLPGDAVEYIMKDNIIYIKGAPWYKIEKLTADELVTLHVFELGKDLDERSYFKKVKTF